MLAIVDSHCYNNDDNDNVHEKGMGSERKIPLSMNIYCFVSNMLSCPPYAKNDVSKLKCNQKKRIGALQTYLPFGCHHC